MYCDSMLFFIYQYFLGNIENNILKYEVFKKNPKVILFKNNS